MTTADDVLRYRDRELSLVRLDADRRAWNAADRHVLAHLEEQPPDGPVLIIDDAHGALTVALHEYRPTHLGDSVLAQKTTLHNLTAAELDSAQVTFLPATIGISEHAERQSQDLHSHSRDPDDGRASNREAQFALVLLRIPRSIALLRFYLNTLKPMIGSSTRVIAFGMTRHLSPNLKSLLAEELGAVRVSPVRQKSVLFHIQPEKLEVDAKALAPDRYPLTMDLIPEPWAQGVEIWSYPGVFSQKRLDMGTRLLLLNLPSAPPGATIVDLGCGAGIVGLSMARRKPDAKVILVDDSFLASRSAELTLSHNEVKAEVRADDGLSSFEPGSIDVIVSNPPIHDGGAYEVEESLRLLRQAAAALRKPGSLRVVSVHGADLGTHLQEIFPRVSRVASDRRFAVWSASY